MPSLGQMKYTCAFSGDGVRAPTGTACRITAVSIKTIVLRIILSRPPRGSLFRQHPSFKPHRTCGSTKVWQAQSRQFEV
jgi:hypothetical protein